RPTRRALLDQPAGRGGRHRPVHHGDAQGRIAALSVKRVSRGGLVPEQPVPLASPVSDALMLGRLIATRDAARMALGGLHIGSTPVASDLLALLSSWGTLRRPALPLFAVRRH